MEFNELHPSHFALERGWKKEPNPFLLSKPRPAPRSSDRRIFIYANQLFYDIDATTNMVARARRGNQTNQEDTIPTSENTQERPIFYRWFDKYIKKTEGLLSAYIMKQAGKVRDNALKEWEEKELWLRMPDYWDGTRYESLTKAIHDYIVLGALVEYFSLTLTSKDPVTVDKVGQLEDAELEILDAANAVKPGGMVRSLKPFG